MAPCARTPASREGVDPHLPILAAHDGGGVGDFLVGGGLDGDVGDDALVGIDGLGGVGGADGLEDGLEGLAGLRMRAAGGGEAVDDGVDLAEVSFDEVDGLLLDGVGEGVAVDALRVKAGGVGGVLRRRRSCTSRRCRCGLPRRVSRRRRRAWRRCRRRRRQCARRGRSRWRSRSRARASACRREDPSISRSQSDSVHWPRSPGGGR